MKFDVSNYLLQEADRYGNGVFLAGLIALLVSLIGYFTDSAQFFFSYLVAYLFWVSVGLGALFFLLLSHLTGAVWSLVLRRINEHLVMVLPYMAVLFIPIFFGLHDLYHWTHSDAVAADEILQKKSAYLNVPFFIIRTVVYFAVWYLIARKLHKTSLKQDAQPDAEQVKSMRRVSAAGMVLFAITASFAAFDWLMSLDPHWYSTIYGLYFFAGGLLSFLALITVIVLRFNQKGILQNVITIEHLHDLAKLMFGFTIFWGYMAFSQYFLIWYANIPEETIWYLHRWEGSWKVFTMTLVLGHFLLPFIGFLTRAAKRSRIFLMFIGLWLLLMHWIDLYWNVMPVHHHGIHLSWMDFTLFVGMAGIYMGFFMRKLRTHPLVPAGEARLSESISFVN